MLLCIAARWSDELSQETCTALQVVIGNVLETRKTEVVVVTAREEKWIRIENPTTEEIEKFIVDELIHRHTEHISSLALSS